MKYLTEFLSCFKSWIRTYGGLPITASNPPSSKIAEYSSSQSKGLILAISSDVKVPSFKMSVDINELPHLILSPK